MNKQNNQPQATEEGYIVEYQDKHVWIKRGCWPDGSKHPIGTRSLAEAFAMNHLWNARAKPHHVTTQYGTFEYYAWRKEGESISWIT